MMDKNHDLANEIVAAIVGDLRDRRWLKWVFGPPGSCELVQEGVERIPDDIQEKIYESWRQLALGLLNK